MDGQTKLGWFDLALIFAVIAAWAFGFSAMAPAQTASVRIYEPAMPVLKQGLTWRLAQAQKEVGDCTIDFGSGEKSWVDNFNETIQPTYVRKTLRGRYVDPCISTGTDSFGGVLTLYLPKERVLFGVAQPMTASGTYTFGKEVWDASVYYPASRASFDGIGRKMAAAVLATGTLTKRR